jgi:two-component system phosphate regulon sensor histidine kinase PhoR
MHRQGWKTELARFGALLGIGAFFGLVLDLLPWFLCGTSIAYALWSLNQLQELNRWLHASAGRDEPPEAGGLRGEVFDILSQVQKATLKINARLLANIGHLRASFSSMADAVVMLSPDSAIEWSNQAEHTLLGLRHPDDTGRRF